jgi:hypothetical protein
VHDLIVHPRERELVAGTHGRSVWIVDVLPVQELTAAVRDKALHVFPLAPVKADRGWRGEPPRWFDISAYQPKLTIPFWSAHAGTAKVAILDEARNPLRRFELAVKPGINRTEWDVLVERELALAAEKAANEKVKLDPATDGALAKMPYAESVRLNHRLYAIPGKYTVEVSLDEARVETALEIQAPEPRKPRVKSPPKVRGKHGWPGAPMIAEPAPRSRANRKPKG